MSVINVGGFTISEIIITKYQCGSCAKQIEGRPDKCPFCGAEFGWDRLWVPVKPGKRKKQVVK